MRQKLCMILALLCMIGLCAFTASEKSKDTAQTIVSPESEQDTANGTETEAPTPEQTPWQVYICPDMPEPYLEVLKQYESFINTEKPDRNDDTVMQKLYNGEWEYVHDELSGIWISPDHGWTDASDIPCYALADLTGDGFPELIMGWGGELIPQVIYTYSEEKGVEMSYMTTSYFTMTICETGILEVDSAGVGYSTITYLQYREEAQDWGILDKTAVSNTWDSATDTTETEYFKLSPGKTGDPDLPISEEEYLRIGEKYAAEPMKLKWNPLVHNKTNLWYSYEEVMYPDLPDAITFMSSRDGQGFHPWIYREASYIMHDYGKRVGYDFISDHWTVEHIWPIEGGCYNILLSQDNQDVVLNLLCRPDERNHFDDRKYVVLYAQYENGDRNAGVNEIPYDTQLEWRDFDYHEYFESPTVENPFEDLHELSIYQPCCIALYHYGQETGYDGEWHIRQIFGRSPFFDYLVESENGFLWICADIGQHYYTYVPL